MENPKHDEVEVVQSRMKERVSGIEERARTVTEAIDNALAPHQARIDKTMQMAITANTSRRIKIIKLQEIVSELRSYARGYVACKQGCSNCCHMRVELTQTEADVIGARIGRRPVQLRQTYVLKKQSEYGPLTPCTFLKAGECSIYESRPLVCRSHVNLDVDNLLCGFEIKGIAEFSGENNPAPLLPLDAIGDAYNAITANDVFADIRDFFPPI